MGTSAFDALWDDAPAHPARRAGDFDELWGDDGKASAAPSPTQTMVRAALKQPQGRARLEQGYADLKAAETPSKLDYADDVRQVPETVVAGIPGVTLARSLVQSQRTGRPLADVQREVNAETSAVPEGSRFRTLSQVGTFGGKLLGATVGMTALPALSGTAGGALLGGASGALTNEPGVTAGGRVGRGVAGAAGGAAAGKATDMAMAGIRGLAASGGEAAKDAALEARSTITDPLYARMRGQPAGPLTPELSAAYQHPDVAPIVAKLQQLEQYKGKDVTDPDFVMAVRKNLSDWGRQLDKAGMVTDPSKANLLGDMKEHVGLLKDAFDTAAETQVPGFRDAVQGFADASAPVNAQEAGYDAMRRKLSGGLTAWKNIGRKTPGALADALAGQGSDAGRGAVTGVLAAGRDAFREGNRFGTLSAAPSLLRVADQTAGNVRPEVAQKGFLALLNTYLGK